MSGYDFIAPSAWSTAEITKKLHLKESPYIRIERWIAF